MSAAKLVRWLAGATFAYYVVTLPVVAEELSATARVDSLAWDYRVVGNRVIVNNYSKVTVLKPAGAEFGSVSVWTSPLMNLTSFAARQFDADGKPVAKWGKGDLEKACGFGQGFEIFTDQCNNYLSVASVKYPYTVEVNWELELKSLYLLSGADLNWKVPITTAIVRLRYPKNQPIQARSYQLEGEPIVEEIGGERLLTWVYSGLSPQKSDPYSPPELADGRRIEFTAEKFELDKYDFDGLSWKNVGLFVKRLGEAMNPPAPTVPARNLDPVVARRTADSLYRHITSSTRYVAAYVGIGGWQPHPLAHIRQRQYGDCKDLSALLTEDLRSCSIRAFPCLLTTNDEGATDPSFVSFGFNHVITMALIGTDTLWYDPTCTHCPPGEIRSDDEGAFSLALTDTGGVLVRTPLSRPEANRIVRVTEITADSVGRIALKVHVSVSGHFAADLRGNIEHQNKKELDQYISDWLLGSRAHLKVTSYTLSNVDDITQPVQIDYTVSCAQPIEWINRTRYLLPFFFTSRNVYSDIETKARETDIWLGYPWEQCDTVIVHGSLLSASDPAVLPADTVLAYPWVQVSAAYAREDTVVTASLTQTYLSDVVPVSSLADFKAYIGRRRWLVDQPVKYVAKVK